MFGPPPFDFKTFEHLPQDARVSKAQAAADRMFPAGSRVSDAEETLRKSGARCEHGVGKDGPYVACYRQVRQFLLVSTDWRVIVHADASGELVDNVFVGREVTGP